MRNKSGLKFQTLNSAALAACLCLAFAVSSAAQDGDLTGGVGQFAVQPKKGRAVAQAKPKPPSIKTGTRASVNDRLLVAANKGDAATTADLLKKGADVNARPDDGWTPLLWACWQSQDNVVKLLLAKGADVNARDKDNDTALMKAATQKIAFPGQRQTQAAEGQFQKDLAIVQMLI